MLTVGRLLGKTESEGVKLIGGRTGLARRVTNLAAVSDWGQAVERMGSFDGRGIMLCCSWDELKAEPEKILEAAFANGFAGLAFKSPALSFAKLLSLGETADRVGLPLLLLPLTMDLSRFEYLISVVGSTRVYQSPAENHESESLAVSDVWFDEVLAY